MKGAAETNDLLKIRIQLMKPVTWIPLLWGVVCRYRGGREGRREIESCLRSSVVGLQNLTHVPLHISLQVCGAAASGNYHWANPFDQANPDAVPLSLGLEDAAKAVTCMVRPSFPFSPLPPSLRPIYPPLCCLHQLLADVSTPGCTSTYYHHL